MKKQIKCPCHSKKKYSDCCRKYHQNALPETALVLMRSRYSAYALGLVEYIMRTTDPANPNYQVNVAEWANQIKHFSENTSFVDLEILEFIDGPETSYVTFKAGLKQGLNDVSFIEKSLFVKTNNQWLYADGVRLI